MPDRLIEEEKTDTTSRNNQRYNMVNFQKTNLHIQTSFTTYMHTTPERCQKINNITLQLSTRNVGNI